MPQNQSQSVSVSSSRGRLKHTLHINAKLGSFPLQTVWTPISSNSRIDQIETLFLCLCLCLCFCGLVGDMNYELWTMNSASWAASVVEHSPKSHLQTEPLEGVALLCLSDRHVHMYTVSTDHTIEYGDVHVCSHTVYTCIYTMYMCVYIQVRYIGVAVTSHDIIPHHRYCVIHVHCMYSKWCIVKTISTNNPRGFPSILTSLHSCMTEEILEMRSAACWRTLAALLLSLQRMVPHIWGRYGFTRTPSEFTTTPNPFSMMMSWNGRMVVWKHENVTTAREYTSHKKFLFKKKTISRKYCSNNCWTC